MSDRGESWDRAKLLPAWFVERMMGDCWFFALLTNDGIMICISTITDVRQAADGSIWLDVELLTDETFWVAKLREGGFKTLIAPSSRTTASINAAHVVAAFEIADT